MILPKLKTPQWLFGLFTLSLLLGSASFCGETVKVFILAGQSNMVGHGKVENGLNPKYDPSDPSSEREIPAGIGSLRDLSTQQEIQERFPQLLDREGQWKERDDVWTYSTARGKAEGKLSVGFGKGDWFGPELGFGHIVGDAFEEPVLIIKTAWGGHSLGIDFRPPSAGQPKYSKTKFEPEKVGASYREMLRIIEDITDDPTARFPKLNGSHFPELRGKHFEFAGFGWHQGWNDAGSAEMVAEYESNMIHLIQDLRKALNTPELPVVIANTGMIGWEATGLRAELCEIQMQIGTHPQLQGTVASVETRGFKRSDERSPSTLGYHWNHNAESHLLLGESMGEMMLKLIRKEPIGMPLFSALKELSAHLEGSRILSAAELSECRQKFQRHSDQVAVTRGILETAFQLVENYDTIHGPLFLNDATRRNLNRDATDRELDLTLFYLQQAIIDHAYTPEQLKRHRAYLDGKQLQTAAYFPGTVEPPSDPNQIHTVTINASQPAYWGRPVAFAENPARRPTGCYLAPGSIARITVPPQMVDQGYSVRVGAHSWDLQRKRPLRRLDRVSLLYPIDKQTIEVANPLGGGIYIEVPYLADAGIVDVAIRNAIRSPFYSTTAHRSTSNAQWLEERLHPGPWADFETDKFMMQVPTNWIYAYEDPASLMRDWDTAMDCVSKMLGLPLVRNKSVLYVQIDTIIRAGAYSIGYPQSNNSYNPLKDEKGQGRHWFLKGPQTKAQTMFHELGHAQLFSKFRGETEAAVNFLYVAVLNNGFGLDLDTAFSLSMGSRPITMEQAAMNWMVTENFRKGNPMDITNSTKNQKRYQHRGFAKYADIVKLFGWSALEDFWHAEHVDYMNGINHPKNQAPDDRILRMSIAAGVDLTPLIHFWGVHPEDPEQLRAQIRKHGLAPSPKIRERLEYYQSIVPMDSAAFRAHARQFIGREPQDSKHPDYGEGWYFDRLDAYGPTEGSAAQAAIQKIIDLYFGN